MDVGGEAILSFKKKAFLSVDNVSMFQKTMNYTILCMRYV